MLDTAVVAKSEGIDNALVQKVQGLSQLEAQIRKSVATFTYDADGELGENAKNDQFPTAEILNVYKSNDGAMAIVVQAPGFRESTSDPQLTVMVIIAEGKIAGWELISAGSNNQFSDYTKGEKFYIGASIDGTIEKQIVSGSTLSGNALYEIVNLAALYARTSI